MTEVEIILDEKVEFAVDAKKIERACTLGGPVVGSKSKITDLLLVDKKRNTAIKVMKISADLGDRVCINLRSIGGTVVTFTQLTVIYFKFLFGLY